jgi:hypothetical protein
MRPQAALLRPLPTRTEVSPRAKHRRAPTVHQESFRTVARRTAELERPFAFVVHASSRTIGAGDEFGRSRECWLSGSASQRRAASTTYAVSAITRTRAACHQRRPDDRHIASFTRRMPSAASLGRSCQNAVASVCDREALTPSPPAEPTTAHATRFDVGRARFRPRSSPSG